MTDSKLAFIFFEIGTALAVISMILGPFNIKSWSIACAIIASFMALAGIYLAVNGWNEPDEPTPSQPTTPDSPPGGVMKKNEKKLRKKINWGKVVAIAVFATLLSSILFIAIAMAMAPSEPNPAEPYRRVKGDYVLMLLQCIVGVAAMLLPSLLKRTLNLVIPSKMMLLFAVFSTAPSI